MSESESGPNRTNGYHQPAADDSDLIDDDPYPPYDQLLGWLRDMLRTHTNEAMCQTVGPRACVGCKARKEARKAIDPDGSLLRI